MKLPRGLSGQSLAKKLSVFGYHITRQKGSHLRLSTYQGGEHHITIPGHNNLKIGTLSNIITDIAQHLKIPKNQLLKQLKL